MKESERQDLIFVLRDSIKAIKENDITQLREVSDHTLHDSSIFQDTYSTSIAVIIYSLSKIYQKNQYKLYKNWNEFNNKCINLLSEALKEIKKGNIKGYSFKIQELYKLISSLENKFGMYITEVLSQSKVKKSSRIFEHGISAGRAAEMLGISTWDLMTYLGQTKIIDTKPLLTKSIKERLSYARELFR
jgi:type III secretory pathway component EscV